MREAKPKCPADGKVCVPCWECYYCYKIAAEDFKATEQSAEKKDV